MSVRATLRRRRGPVTLGAAGLAARIEELVVGSTARATTVEAHGGALRVGTVEHVFAALAGLGIYDGLALSIEGPEMPLLDGGAAAWCDAIDRLDVSAGPPPARVTREAVVEVGASRYEFAPGGRVEVEVRVEFAGFDETRIAPEARWAGDAPDFQARIAPARTFALARDTAELVASGLARGVDPTSVVVVAPDAIHSAGAPFAPDEPARHKVLDLMGDCTSSAVRRSARARGASRPRGERRRSPAGARRGRCGARGDVGEAGVRMVVAR